MIEKNGEQITINDFLNYDEPLDYRFLGMKLRQMLAWVLIKKIFHL